MVAMVAKMPEVRELSISTQVIKLVEGQPLPAEAMRRAPWCSQTFAYGKMDEEVHVFSLDKEVFVSLNPHDCAQRSESDPLRPFSPLGK